MYNLSLNMKVAIYIRVSTPGQAINGESLEMQKERLLEYVKAHGWELFKTYEDGGFSGKNTNRPAFQEMIHDAELKKFDILVVYKIDRLSRSILDFHTTMKFLEKQGISFVSVTQQFDTTNSMGRLMLAILVDFANFEREINIDRALDSYLKRLNNGVSSGAIPYGYKRMNKEVIIISEEAERVKELYTLASQGHSMNDIARQTGFTKYHVRSILTNPYFTGSLTRRRDKFNHRTKEHSWEWHKGAHEPIISLELWQKVAELREKKYKISKSKHQSLFSHLIYCPYCKHNLSFHIKNRHKRTELYYECDPVKLDEKSCYQYLREEPLEAILLNYINKSYNVNVSFPRKQIDNEDKILNIDRKIKKILRYMEEDLKPFEEGKSEINKLKEEKAKLLAAKIIEPDYSLITEQIKKIKQVYHLATREEKARLWHLLIDKIEAYKDVIVIHWHSERKQKITRIKLQIVPYERAESSPLRQTGDSLKEITELERLLSPLNKFGNSLPSD